MHGIFSLVFLALAPPGGDAPAPSIENPPPYPEAGSNLPGPFTAINVNGKKRGQYNCLVSEHNLDPGVIVFIKGTEVPMGLEYLLKKLEEAVQRNVHIRLGGFVVFYVGKEETPPTPPTDNDFQKLKDAIFKLTREDDRMESLRIKVEDVARGAKLDNARAAFAPRSSLAKYKIDDKTDVTVVLYDRFRVVDKVWSLTLEEMTEEKAKEIREAMYKKLGANR